MKTHYLHRLFVLLLAIAVSAQADAKPAGSPVDRRISDFTLGDYRGREYSLTDFAEHRLLVVAFLGTECPLAKLYGGRLAEMARDLNSRGVGFVGLNANSQDSLSEIAAYARLHEIEFPILKDLNNRVADQLGAVRTPEVFLLDEDRVVRYWGRIDDQYGIGFAREKPREQDLLRAIDQLLAGEEVTLPVVSSVGCHIGRVREPSGDTTVTYSNQIARLLQNRCVECHREGEIAPFALTDYDEVVGWAEMIAEVVREKRMPPWHANETVGSFENERHLSEAEKKLIASWVQAGAPEGDPNDLPAPRTWVTGWQLPREPDFVARLTEKPFPVPANGEVRYQYFQIDPRFEEDKWVSAVEIQPGNRAVVHHVLMFAGTGQDVRDRFGGGTRGYDGVFVPGQRVSPYPDGMAKRIRAGSQLIFQVHYTPIGSKQFDQSRVGMNFVDPTDVRFEVRTTSAVNGQLRIPPHEDSYRVEAASPRMPATARLLSLTPHMHLRGKSFSYEAVFPDGQRELLLDVPHYDFNWQTAYRLVEPKELPQGTRLQCVAHFDNSAKNLNNPDPSARVRWGDQTWDEMMIGYFDYVVQVGTSSESIEKEQRSQQIQALFDRLDKNADGNIVVDEVPRRFRQMFDQLDRDDNGSLTLQELSRAPLFGRRGRR